MTDIGQLISKSREDLGLTQDQFGRRYNVSGPAIFKFEKGYVRPSLELWLSICKDIDISEEVAVLMWVRAKLPRKYQDFISLEPGKVREPATSYGKPRSPAKTARKKAPESLRDEILADRKAPQGLKRLLKDEDFWALYKPEAEELDLLRNVFGPLGDGSKASYRQALRLLREFSRPSA